MTDANLDQSDWYGALVVPGRSRPRLTFDLDVDLCVIGGGLAGLTAAREAARLGATVAVLEAREIAWNASGFNLGTVAPGFAVNMADIVDRIGLDHTRELWALSQQGADYVRDAIITSQMPGIALSEGALEVSQTDHGDRLLSRLQLLREGFGADVEGWQADRVRTTLGTSRYFHAIHFPQAFQIHSLNYARGLAALAEQAGVRIFEQTPVVSIDPGGIRKRIMTAGGRVRASFIVLAGNVHLGATMPRLSRTLLPVWRYMALTAPLGAALSNVMSFAGSVTDAVGIDHYRIVNGDRLLWSSASTTWPRDPRRFAQYTARRIRKVFPALRDVKIADVWSGATGDTVHGMPQIGELGRGVWVASGFGRQGLNTTAMAGQVIAAGMLSGDDRWRLFSPFELIWSGGRLGRIVARGTSAWVEGQAAGAGTMARYREGLRLRKDRRAVQHVAGDQSATGPDIDQSSAPVDVPKVEDGGPDANSNVGLAGT